MHVVIKCTYHEYLDSTVVRTVQVTEGDQKYTYLHNNKINKGYQECTYIPRGQKIRDTGNRRTYITTE